MRGRIFIASPLRLFVILCLGPENECICGSVFFLENRLYLTFVSSLINLYWIFFFQNRHIIYKFYNILVPNTKAYLTSVALDIFPEGVFAVLHHDHGEAKTEPGHGHRRRQQQQRKQPKRRQQTQIGQAQAIGEGQKDPKSSCCAISTKFRRPRSR